MSRVDAANEALNAAQQDRGDAPQQEEMVTLPDALQALEQVTRRKKELEARLKDTNKEVGYLAEHLVPELMRKSGLVSDDDRGSVTLASGATVYLRTDLYASCPKAVRPKMLASIRQMGYEELIEENVHPMTLKSFVKDRLEEGEEVPEGVNVTTVLKAIVKGLK